MIAFAFVLGMVAGGVVVGVAGLVTVRMLLHSEAWNEGMTKAWIEQQTELGRMEDLRKQVDEARGRWRAPYPASASATEPPRH